MTYLCMSWDHRALDGALAAQFLAALKARLEAVDGPTRRLAPSKGRRCRQERSRCPPSSSGA